MRRILKHVLLAGLLLTVCLFYTRYREDLRYYTDTISQLYEEASALVERASEKDFGAGQASRAYAEDGTVILKWQGSRNVDYIVLDEIPAELKNAMICTEDRRFYMHHGVDYRALLRAFFALVKNGGKVTQGGSTITMQLARTMYLTREVSWQRKVKEIFLAWKLEKQFSKEQILEFYLNNIYFGNGYYGIGSAAEGYFHKAPDQLSLAQTAYLCAIPNNPTLYDPYVNSSNTEKRMIHILNCMLEENSISEEEYTLAASEKVLVEEPEMIEKDDYTATYVSYCAVHALMENAGFEFCYDFQSEEQRNAYEAEYAQRYAECQALMYTEGYQVYTSFDRSLQKILQNAVDSELKDYLNTDEKGVYEMQGASVCIDNATGLVKAIVGGRSQEHDFYPLNRAYQSFRQPGSSIKPLIVYTPALERGYMPDTVVEDRPAADGPRNATGHYQGEVTLRYAVEQSLNTVAYNLFRELTPETGLSYLKAMEFSQIVPEDYGLPSALGGFTYGVSPLEMASGYETIANGGVFRSPTCVVRILDKDGNVIYEPDGIGKRVYDQEAAETMEDVLAGVMTNGTGAPVNLDGVFCAGKTGTTNEYKDSWFVGYTKRYTVSVWVGYDMPKEIAGITGPSYSGFIWKRFMETALETEQTP